MVPYGRLGKGLIKEMTRLFRAYAENSALECMALKAAFLLPLLLLQKPHRRSKAKDHLPALEHRFALWNDGAFMELLNEGEKIQRKLSGGACRTNRSDLCSSFSKLMSEGKVRGALRLLNNTGSSAGLPLLPSATVPGSDPPVSVKDILIDKHPPPSPFSPSHCHTPAPDHEPLGFEFSQIDGGLIRNCFLKMSMGAAGPSGMDVAHWRKVCSSFAKESADLCDAIACVTHKICSSYVDPVGISALVACRLIALDKDPGVRPIGIGEVVRRVMSKAILGVLKSEILEVAGSRQMCAGQDSPCESIVHSLRSLFDSGSVDGLLIVVASNAFNALNRSLALRNILALCPSLGRVLINTYRVDVSLFVGDETIPSREGTTQGDPLAMAMFALATVPLIKNLEEVTEVTQLWYADDASAAGSLSNLKSWWVKLTELGKEFGYLPNAGKTSLLVNIDNYEKAC